MATATSVSDANNNILPSMKEQDNGLANLISLTTKGTSILCELAIRLDPENTVVAVGTGLSGGVTLPLRSLMRDFRGYGSNVVATKAAWDALADDATRDNTNILTDTDAPIGSTYTGLAFSAGAVTGSKMWLKTAAATWTDLTL